MGIGFFFFLFSSEQAKGFFSTSVCLNPRVPGHIFMLRQARSPEEGLCQPGWMRAFCKSLSLMDPFMLILVMVEEGDPGVISYKTPFACIFKLFYSKLVWTVVPIGNSGDEP